MRIVADALLRSNAAAFRSHLKTVPWKSAEGYSTVEIQLERIGMCECVWCACVGVCLNTVNVR